MHIYIYFTRLLTKVFQMGMYPSSDLDSFGGTCSKTKVGACVKKQGAAAHPKTSLGVLKCPKIVGKDIIIPFHEDFCAQFVKLGTIANCPCN